MKPENLATKIFLDSGDPNETREIIKLLGFLDGQTTNPTLISKNPDLIPNGSVSVEVYADKNTTAEEMFRQGQKMFDWIPNAHIKYPIALHSL